jgi:uncharacterized protein YggU (UPF0235/DUF167 family)
VDGGVMLHVRVTPKASANAVVGIEARGDTTVLSIKVRALPDKGEANDAVIATLAKWLGMPKATFRLAAGGKARLKQIFIAGEPAGLMARLAAMFQHKGEKP